MRLKAERALSDKSGLSTNQRLEVETQGQEMGKAGIVAFLVYARRIGSSPQDQVLQNAQIQYILR
jgi:hypothetical protein